ncbi:MAG TPA: hypothetical protein VE735_07380 [Gammaproteobacteria bacterium]|jgi:Co/Zn/Cd efflux system component|nr:hypothetical protein [Gammaproteobacteria bacterium]
MSTHQAMRGIHDRRHHHLDDPSDRHSRLGAWRGGGILGPSESYYAAAVLVVNIAFTVWEHHQAEHLDSDLLRADAGHTLSDVAVTLVVIAG